MTEMNLPHNPIKKNSGQNVQELQDEELISGVGEDTNGCSGPPALHAVVASRAINMTTSIHHMKLLCCR